MFRLTGMLCRWFFLRKFDPLNISFNPHDYFNHDDLIIYEKFQLFNWIAF